MDRARRWYTNGSYKDLIEKQRKEWIGAKVKWQGESYTVIDVDYNGALLIDKPALYTPTTAVDTSTVERI